MPTPMSSDPTITEVMVMFKCHLDVGFTNTEAAVLTEYFGTHFPNAIATAEKLEAAGGPENYVWTMPAWLLYEYLEQCGPAERCRADDAILAGHLSWHALPFTWFSELLDASIVTTALALSGRMDRRYGRHTRSARFTDVPGHTRGIIGPLVDAGIDFLNIGVNSGCKPPRVPTAPGSALAPMSEHDTPDAESLARHERSHILEDFGTPEAEVLTSASEGINDPNAHLFRWSDSTGRELNVLYHCRDYGSTVRIPGTSTVASMRLRSDNFGPHPAESVISAFASLHRKFPNACIRATDLNPIAESISAISDHLPLVTQEIGDSWIYGTAADPAKTAGLRAVMRARRGAINDGLLQAGSDEDVRGVRSLIQAPEHNWGLNTAEYLRSRENFLPEDLADARRTDSEFVGVDTEWARQRSQPVRAAAHYSPPVRARMEAALRDLHPAPPHLDDYEPVLGGTEFTTGPIRWEISPTLLIRSANDSRNSRQWSPATAFLQVSYQRFDTHDYQRFSAAYNTKTFTQNDFGKPGLQKWEQPAGLFPAEVTGLFRRRGADHPDYLAALTFRVPEPDRSGHPRSSWLQLEGNGDSPTLEVTVLTFDKPATRIPEALWVSFLPTSTAAAGWTMNKLDEPVDPTDVIEDGGRLLHAIQDQIRYADEGGGIAFASLDAPLVAPGRMALLHFDNEPVDPSGGIHFNVYNNLWGTAFPQWCDQDMQFRFTVDIEQGIRR